jgi:hypothetical protein
MRKPKGIKANKNERMIEVKLRFWTNGIAKGAGYVVPKHAWSGGVVRIERNHTHKIKPGSPKPFHSLLDVGAVIERVLIAQGITLHPSKRMKKYVDWAQ